MSADEFATVTPGEAAVAAAPADADGVGGRGRETPAPTVATVPISRQVLDDYAEARAERLRAEADAARALREHHLATVLDDLPSCPTCGQRVRFLGTDDDVAPWACDGCGSHGVGDQLDGTLEVDEEDDEDDDGPSGDGWIHRAYMAQSPRPREPHFDGGRLVR